MKIYAKNDDSVNIRIWGRKDGNEGKTMPRQADKSNEIFDIFIDNEKITVYFNTSKSHVPYYYLKFSGLWHWTTDNIRNYSQYTTNIPVNSKKSLQEIFAPNGICFGCGVVNEKGLRIKSFAEGDEYFAEWRADAHHQAFPGMLNGGIVGALLDCHSNWAAAHFLMKKTGKTEPDCTVTANYSIKLLRPTPFDTTIYLKARVVESTDTTATVEAELIANEKVCATCKGLFVVVKEGHPAYHRW